MERGKGHGIIGSMEFLERMKEEFLSGSFRSREVPAVKKIVGQVEPEKILDAVANGFGVSREVPLKRGSGGVARAVLMELLYRYGGLNQREIGELMGIDYSAVSVNRKKSQALQEKDRNLVRQIEEIRMKLIQV